MARCKNLLSPSLLALSVSWLATVQIAECKVIEAGVKYDFDASGKQSFADLDLHDKPISWERWHANLDQAIAAKQYELLVSRWHTRSPAFVVIDYSVTSTGHIQARALKSGTTEYQDKFREAQLEYRLNEIKSQAFLQPNLQFEELTLKAYRAMQNSPVLNFPPGSNRKLVHDVRWHIDAVGIERSVRSRSDDVETR